MAAKPIEGLKSLAHKTPKSMVVYMDGDKGPFKCANCEYFQDPSSCKKVEGKIDPEGCCNLYEKG